MNYIDEIFLRADIRQIRAFLLEGVPVNIDPRPWLERIRSADREMDLELSKRYPDDMEREKVTGPIYSYGEALKEVYMEIGLQAGALLAGQVWQSLNTARERENIRR